MGFMTLHGGALRDREFATSRAGLASTATGSAATGAATTATSTAATPASYTVPTAIAHSTTTSMINPSIMYMRNPFIGNWFIGAPEPRSSFALPVLISMDPTPTDATLFEEPADPSKKHYLTKFKIAVQGSGGGQQENVSFAADANGFTLTVQLADATDAMIAANNARIAPSTSRYMLT